MPCQHLRAPLTIIALLACAIGSGARQHCAPVRSTIKGWPQFRGPARDGIVAEKGLLQEWPERGPAVLWTAAGIGSGYSSPIVSQGRLYITGDTGGACRVTAMDLTGRVVWQQDNGAAWTKSYPGARASVTLDGDRLYHMNAHGRVVCLDQQTGKERWSVDILERFEAPNIRWAISECLVIDRDHVIVTPGGPNALMAALDKHTGETAWQTDPLRFTRTHKFGGKTLPQPTPDTDKAGYTSPLLFELGGRRFLASCSARHLFCVDADKGELCWTHAVFAQWEVIGSMATAWRDSLFFSAPDDFGGKLFHFALKDGALVVEEKWQVPLDSCHGSAVVVNDVLYGSGHKRHKPWTAVDLKQGSVRYTRDNLHNGAAIYADNRLYALAQNGVLALLAATSDGFDVKGQIKLTDGSQKDVWAHPVILNGRLYLRYHDTLRCYDIAQR